MMVAFGIPNGDLSGAENDVIDEPDTEPENPFGDGVENGNGLDEPVEPSATTDGNFHVDEEKLEEEEEIVVFGIPSINDVIVDDQLEDPEQPGSFNELDNVHIVTGEELLDFVVELDDENITLEEEDTTYSDLDIDSISNESFSFLGGVDDESWDVSSMKAVKRQRIL